jgi:hypothetical protein
MCWENLAADVFDVEDEYGETGRQVVSATDQSGNRG